MLAAIGAGTAGLAGCLGGGGGDGGGGDGNGGELRQLQVPEGVADGDPGACSAIVEGYTRYDGEGSPFVATFEYPGSVAATGTVNDEHSLTLRATVDGQPFDMFPTIYMEGSGSQTPAMKGEVSGLEAIATLNYDGESLPVVRASGGSNGDDAVTLYDEYPYFVVGVPHEGTYYRYDFRATVQFGDLETGFCEATWERAAKRMISSLEPNPGTSIESA